MKTYTKDEKKAYFQSLRTRWQTIKEGVTSGRLDEIKAIISEHGLNVSPWSFAFTAQSMAANGYDGIPYLDCKTFNGWMDRGFRVKKGEKSRISGIVWLSVDKKNESGDERLESSYKMPKEYHLFHRSQVEEV